jgi:hypothetical protein
MGLFAVPQADVGQHFQADVIVDGVDLGHTTFVAGSKVSLEFSIDKTDTVARLVQLAALPAAHKMNS